MYVRTHAHIHANTPTGRNSARLIDGRSVVAATAAAAATIEIAAALALVLARTQLIRGEAMSRNVKLVTVRETHVNRLRLPTRANKYCSTVTKPGGFVLTKYRSGPTEQNNETMILACYALMKHGKHNNENTKI